MKLIPLNCRQCGAPLSVPEDVKHVTCMHCGTQLGVVHEGGAAYTEKLQQLDQRTCEVEQRLNDLDRKQQIAELDQAWEKDKMRYYVRDKHGRTYPPSLANVAAAAILTAVGCTVAVGFPLVGNASSEMIGVGFIASCVVLLVGFVICLVQYGNLSAYREAKLRYLYRRENLLRQD